MTVATHIGIPADGFELGRVFADTGARIELTQLVPGGGDLIPYFWATDIENEAAFEATVLDQPAVATITHHGGLAEKSLYQIEWADGIDGLLHAIAESDIIVEGAAGTAEEWVFQIRTHDHEALLAFHDHCLEHDITLDIYRVTATSDTAADTRYNLSEALSNG